MRPTMKLKNQFVQVVMATPFARRLDEWTSAAGQKDQLCFFQNREYNLRKAQGTGDQPMPKKNMKAIKRPTPAQAALW